MLPALPLTGRNRAPETAALTKSRTLPTDGAVAKFLMTILQQLDMKSLNWQEVADEMGVSNGHAARMRYSRLKTQMGFSNIADRRTKSGSISKKPRNKKVAAKSIAGDDDEDVKSQFQSDGQAVGGNPELMMDMSIKEENAGTVAEPEAYGSSESPIKSEKMQENGFRIQSQASPVIKEEPSEEASALTGRAQDGAISVDNAAIVACGTPIKMEADDMAED